MEQIQLGYSLKDIPTPDDKVYLEGVISSWGKTDKKMRWKVHRINNPGRVARESKNTFGFPTVEAPPMLKADLPTTKALKDFQVGMLDLIREIKFNSNTNEHQVKLKQDIRPKSGCTWLPTKSATCTWSSPRSKRSCSTRTCKTSTKRPPPPTP